MRRFALIILSCLLAVPAHGRPAAPRVTPIPPLPAALAARLDASIAAWHAGRRAESLATAEAVLRDAERELGPNASELVTPLTVLGALHTMHGAHPRGLAATERATALVTADPRLGPRHPALRVLRANAQVTRDNIDFQAPTRLPWLEPPDPLMDVPWDYAGAIAVLHTQDRGERVEFGAPPPTRPGFDTFLDLGPEAGLRLWLRLSGHEQHRTDVLELARRRLPEGDPLRADILYRAFTVAWGANDVAASDLAEELRRTAPARGERGAMMRADLAWFDSERLASAGRHAEAAALLTPWTEARDVPVELRDLIVERRVTLLADAGELDAADALLAGAITGARAREARGETLLVSEQALRILRASIRSLRDPAAALRELGSLLPKHEGLFDPAGVERVEIALAAGDVRGASAALDLMTAQLDARDAKSSSLVRPSEGDLRAHLELALAVARASPERAVAAYDRALARKAIELERSIDLHRRVRGLVDPVPRAALVGLEAMQARLALALAEGASLAELLALQDAVEAHASFLGTRVSTYDASPPANGSEVRAALRDDEAIVEYVDFRPFDAAARRRLERYGPERYGAFVVRRDGVTFYDLGPTREIDALVTRARAAILAGDEAGASLSALADRLTTPLERALADARHVYLAPSGVLATLPFITLGVDPARALTRISSSYLTTGRDLARPRVAPSRNPPVVLADPASSPAGGVPGWPPLPGARAEALAIAPHLVGADLRLGAAASKAALKGVRRPRVLHVASHGYYLRPSDPVLAARSTRGASATPTRALEPGVGTVTPLLLSGLVLGGGGDPRPDHLMTALEASSLDLAGTELVVLSACETGLGAVDPDEGVQGLRYALTAAGAESVVTSLWRVDDDATRALMTTFYQALGAGVDRGEALRRAQLALRDAGRPARDWAAFVLTGRVGPIGRETVTPAARPTLAAPVELASVELSRRCFHLEPAGPGRIQVRCAEPKRLQLVELSPARVVWSRPLTEHAHYPWVIGPRLVETGFRGWSATTWADGARGWSDDVSTYVEGSIGDAVFATRLDAVLRVDVPTGTTTWRRTYDDKGYTETRVLAADGARVVVRRGSAAEVLDAVTGALVWTTPVSPRHVALSGDLLFVGSGDASAVHEVGDGRRLWGVEGSFLSLDVALGARYLAEGVDLYHPFRRGVIVRDARTGAKLWEIGAALPGPKVFAPDDRLFAVDAEGRVRVFDVAHGLEAASAGTYPDIEQLVWLEDRLIVLTADRLHALH